MQTRVTMVSGQPLGAAQHNIGTCFAPAHGNDTGVIEFGACFLYIWTLSQYLLRSLVHLAARPCTAVGAVTGTGLGRPTPPFFTVCETM